jgi:hypothetical protein
MGAGDSVDPLPTGPKRVTEGPGVRPIERRGVVMADYEGYCVKCREKRTFDGQEVELANGRRAAQGACPVCGTKMNRILGKKS